MKSDLATSIIAAIAGVLISYFVCNLLVGPIESTTVDVVETTVSADVSEPSPEVFNYKALNPTVEVYVGSCENGTSDSGECLENVVSAPTDTSTDNPTDEDTGNEEDQ